MFSFFTVLLFCSSTNGRMIFFVLSLLGSKRVIGFYKVLVFVFIVSFDSILSYFSIAQLFPRESICSFAPLLVLRLHWRDGSNRNRIMSAVEQSAALKAGADPGPKINMDRMVRIQQQERVQLLAM